VDFPDLSRSSNQVAGKSHASSSYFDQISDGAIGMAWSIENLESQTLPFMNITPLQCTRNGDRVSKRKQMGTKVVAMVDDVVGRIPESMCFIKEHLLPGRNGHLGSLSNQTRNRRALVSMVMSEQHPINHTASSSTGFSRVDQKGIAIAF